MTGTHIVDAILKDHKEIQAYYEQYLANTDNPTEQEKWANQLRWEIARHSIGEELIVYPAYEKHFPNGKALADKDRAEHQQVKNDLYTLQSLTPGKDADFDPLIAKMMRELRAHIKHEEEEDLPKLRAALSQKDAEYMGRQFETTKNFVPTRSHPSAPDKPPFETLAGLLAAPLDKLRDAFSKFPTTEQVQAVEP
ncbi:hemerythrin HHE cation binding domain-containing protein [Fimicolochytrium jonesii]|uniref:hemerythrin HHE cation binding domain-containing protein n=1 Tax=Fimicolochytrium jonesii TaxID=1396493 RepID=UPI0022FED403|nr:hemerythrin HHE cation binding domain-containing protein [Fimicolochytrium jonesii]KAI8826019.1 hemerythrin HHE cation binding domain-containing protein [Fimicolochytrium jonesii]